MKASVKNHKNIKTMTHRVRKNHKSVPKIWWSNQLESNLTWCLSPNVWKKTSETPKKSALIYCKRKLVHNDIQFLDQIHIFGFFITFKSVAIHLSNQIKSVDLSGHLSPCLMLTKGPPPAPQSPSPAGARRLRETSRRVVHWTHVFNVCILRHWFFTTNHSVFAFPWKCNFLKKYARTFEWKCQKPQRRARFFFPKWSWQFVQWA